jgi:hypothetical protein
VNSLRPRVLGVRRWVWGLLVAAVILRLGVAVLRGFEHDRGDFYATLPGAYAKTLNPALWNSGDLIDSWGYGREVFLYGPTQYLTLLPVIYYFDSYRDIARFLLAVYGLLILASAYLIWKGLQRAGAAPRAVGLAVVATTCLFFPVLQAYVQREFEIVVLFLKAAAFYCLLTSREALGAGLVAYASAFKFLPLLWLPYLALRRWTLALLAFVGVLAIVMGVAHSFFGIGAFADVWALIHLELTQRSSSTALCEAWEPEIRHHAVANATRASVAWALCSFGDRWPALPVPQIFYAILATIALVFVAGFWRLERRPPLTPQDEVWRRAIEVSVVITISSAFVYAHYYYLSMLVIPLNVLMVRYLMSTGGNWTRPILWLCAYLSLGAFLVPSSLAAGVGIDFWHTYMRNALYFYGEMLLIGLLLWEYLTIPSAAHCTDRARYDVQLDAA